MPKKILVIPDSFKDSISSKDFCSVAKSSILKINPSTVVDCIPMGDGGEGSLESFKMIKDYTFKSTIVKSPLGKDIEARYCINRKTKTGIIELAEASGMQLVPKKLRNPLKTTSYGTGQLIKKVISDGMKKIILFIGGSATNDVGIGILDALGFTFYDSNNNQLNANVKNLDKIKKIENCPNYDVINKIDFVIACDVTNPLTGPKGATYYFGKQKGATELIMEFLEKKILHFSKAVVSITSKNYINNKGAGAAGGIGFIALSFLNATFEEGFPLLSKILDLEKKIKHGNYDWIITGEGCIDKQTINGKLIWHLGAMGLNASIPIIAFAGKINDNLSARKLPGITIAKQITPNNMKLNTAIKNASKNLDISIKKEMTSLLI